MGKSERNDAKRTAAPREPGWRADHVTAKAESYSWAMAPAGGKAPRRRRHDFPPTPRPEDPRA